MKTIPVNILDFKVSIEFCRTFTHFRVFIAAMDLNWGWGLEPKVP